MSAKKQAAALFRWFTTSVDPGFRSPASEADVAWKKHIEQELEKAEARGSVRTVHTTREQIESIVRDELEQISQHSGKVCEIDDQIDVVTIESYDIHYKRAIERIVAQILGETPPERHPPDAVEE